MAKPSSCQALVPWGPRHVGGDAEPVGGASAIAMPNLRGRSIARAAAQSVRLPSRVGGALLLAADTHVSLGLSGKRPDVDCSRPSGEIRCFRLSIIESITIFGAGVPGCRGAGVPGCRGAGVPGCRGAGVPGCRGAGVPGCRGAGVPGCSGPGCSGGGVAGVAWGGRGGAMETGAALTQLRAGPGERGNDVRGQGVMAKVWWAGWHLEGMVVGVAKRGAAARSGGGGASGPGRCRPGRGGLPELAYLSWCTRVGVPEVGAPELVHPSRSA
ncbi:hypothetical protein J2S57_005841 [Kineosporia succinea]|uniref:Uncharacterized protein n=1 Tax=Kineosporia succinea TaxID=84632 RepID=A0ABT9PBL2_9ACTN|nr:hypothetical protein [Kineosporia succinea]